LRISVDERAREEKEGVKKRTVWAAGRQASDGKRTKGILLVLPAGPEAEAAVVPAHAAEHGVAEALVHADGECVLAAHEEVDEEATVDGVGDVLEEADHAAREPEAPVLGRDGERGNVPVVVGGRALGLADDWGVQVACQSSSCGEAKTREGARGLGECGCVERT